MDTISPTTQDESLKPFSPIFDAKNENFNTKWGRKIFVGSEIQEKESQLSLTNLPLSCKNIEQTTNDILKDSTDKPLLNLKQNRSLNRYSFRQPMSTFKNINSNNKKN